MPGSASRGLKRLLELFRPSILLIAAVGVGLATGSGIWLFRQMIELAHKVAFGFVGTALAPLGAWTIAIIPALGGLIVGLLWYRFVGHERFHGVAGLMEALALAGGHLQYRLAPVKTLAAALSIGFGASVGPEDPSVQIGANLGSLAGQRLRLSEDWMRALVAAGAAGGISAAFNAPIAGVFFALEVLLGEIGTTALGAVVLASVVSAVFIQSTIGPEPAFTVPAYALRTAVELPLYLGLGLLAGPVAAVYVYSVSKARTAFASLTIRPWLKPVVAGLAVGIVAIFLPEIMGVGYETIGAILAGAPMSVGFLVALLVAKLVLTAVSIGGGFPGGVFAPSLFLGAALGAAYGTVATLLFPGLEINAPAYAMVGMAAMLAGAVHAPLTAILLLFEMTGDYRIILPVMTAVVASVFLSQWLRRDSVYTQALAAKGVYLERGRDVEVLDGISVGEVMEVQPETLHERDTLATAADLFMQTRHHGMTVVDDTGALVGLVTVQDLDRAQAETAIPIDRVTVGEICTRSLVVAYPDESIGTALRRMSGRDIGRLPVVARDNPQQLLGVLRRIDLVRAYDAALTRRAVRRHRAHQTHLDAVSGENVSVVEVLIKPGAPCDGQCVQDIEWPRECVLASVRRGRRVLIPHGDTRLQAGDVLVAVAEGASVEHIRALCRR